MCINEMYLTLDLRDPAVVTSHSPVCEHVNIHVWRSSLVPAANRFQMDFLKKIFQQTNTVVFVTFWLLLRFRVRVQLYGCTE